MARIGGEPLGVDLPFGCPLLCRTCPSAMIGHAAIWCDCTCQGRSADLKAEGRQLGRLRRLWRGKGRPPAACYCISSSESLTEKATAATRRVPVAAPQGGKERRYLLFSDGLLISEAADACEGGTGTLANSVDRRRSRSFSAVLGWGATDAAWEDETLEYGWVSGVHRVSPLAASAKAQGKGGEGDEGGCHEGRAAATSKGCTGSERLLIRLEGGVWEVVEVDTQTRESWTCDLVATAIRLAMQSSQPSSATGWLLASKTQRLPGKIDKNGAARTCVRWLSRACRAMGLSILVALVAVAMQGSVHTIAPRPHAFPAAGHPVAGQTGHAGRSDAGSSKVARGRNDPDAPDAGPRGPDERNGPSETRVPKSKSASDKDRGVQGDGLQRGREGGSVLARLESECRDLSAQQRARGLDGCTHAAAASGKIELLVQLLEGGRGLFERDVVLGQTILHAAAAAGQLRVVELLMKRGGRALMLAVDSEGETCLHAAARSDAVGVVDLLLANGPWTLKKQHSRNGDTCLHTAVRSLAAGAVAALISAGGRDLLQARNEQGQSALGLAEHLASLLAAPLMQSSSRDDSHKVLKDVSQMLRDKLNGKSAANRRDKKKSPHQPD